MPERSPTTDDSLTELENEVRRTKEFIARTSFEGGETEAADELSNVDQHPGDISDMTFTREQDLTSDQILNQEQSLIEDARKKQANGTYGICSDCGAPIEPERLAARPQSIRCINCQRRFELESL